MWHTNSTSDRTSVGYDLTISGNSALTSLAGLDGMTTYPIYAWYLPVEAIVFTMKCRLAGLLPPATRGNLTYSGLSPGGRTLGAKSGWCFRAAFPLHLVHLHGDGLSAAQLLDVAREDCMVQLPECDGSLSISLSPYIHIYTEREAEIYVYRKRDRERNMYIHIYIERERDRCWIHTESLYLSLCVYMCTK